MGSECCTQRADCWRDSFPRFCSRSAAVADQSRNDGMGRRYACSRKEQRSDHQAQEKSLADTRGAVPTGDVPSCKVQGGEEDRLAYCRLTLLAQTPHGALLTRGSMRRTRQSRDPTTGMGLKGCMPKLWFCCVEADMGNGKNSGYGRPRDGAAEEDHNQQGRAGDICGA